MSQNTTKFVRCCYVKLTTCFGPCSGPSSCHKSIYSRKLYSISHKIYKSKNSTRSHCCSIRIMNNDISLQVFIRGNYTA